MINSKIRGDRNEILYFIKDFKFLLINIIVESLQVEVKIKKDWMV